MGYVIRRGKQVRQQAIEIVENGGSYADAAAVTGYCVDYVRQICTKTGTRKTKFKTTPERTSKAIEMIKSGYTAKAIAEALNYSSQNTVYNICRREKLKIHANSKRDETIVDMRKSGCTISYIANKLNITEAIVYGVCKKNGINARLETIKHGTEGREEWRICERCGKPYFAYINSNKKYCSKTCEKANGHERNDIIRRRLKNKLMIDTDISLAKIYERFNGKCCICGGVCDYNDYIIKNGKKCVRAHYPSIDHIIPLSKGGAHTWNNVQLAHIGCNARKGVNVSG